MDILKKLNEKKIERENLKLKLQEVEEDIDFFQNELYLYFYRNEDYIRFFEENKTIIKDLVNCGNKGEQK